MPDQGEGERLTGLPLLGPSGREVPGRGRELEREWGCRGGT